ncbi:unnamed protein product [Cuscuta europaea]|uniref:Uncharacterized protein n=1 Tax=Cuscuta europaea TaxID=41803 RepID=A0A9P0ZKS4_CUSEU|nr:unnamed protein product [Cuscuta europaea]
MSKKSLRWRNDSGELDVFEAAKYFSDSVDSSTFPRKNHHQHETWRRGRRSLDMPVPFRKSSSLILPTDPEMEKPRPVERISSRKHKQPSSPRVRLANFLNSLFNQTKKKSKTEKDNEDEDEIPGRIRSRRKWGFKSPRSVSTTVTTTATSCANAPAKSCKDFAIFPDVNHQRVINHKIISTLAKNKVGSNSTPKKVLSSACEKQILKVRIKRDNEEEDHDDGCSETSSDLFDLPISELMKDLYSSSSGLPVYETTQIDSIKRGNKPIFAAVI